MNDEYILKQLSELTLEEIETAKKRYKKLYPDDRKYVALCEIARNRKMAEARRDDFMDILVELKNAPDGAGTPSQGNETR